MIINPRTMNLKTIPFTDFENNNNYKISSFKELDMNINIINEAIKYQKIPSGNFYKFGVIIDNVYSWYFNGIAVADSREKMREIYSAILQVNNGTNNKPFIYKVKRL